MSLSRRLHHVPTNVITGFLGVGKTTALLHLLKQKPRRERWAVLVNEFGEIGVDGSLFQGLHPQNQGVFVREVPGGCMCCSAGVPMKVALHRLLREARPDRLLIEPTGLGHPKEVLEVLTGGYNRELLSIQKILTLVDARKLREARYTTHKTFLQQVGIADVLVGNKGDLYEEDEHERLRAFARTHGAPEVPVHFTEHGRLSLDWLRGPTSFGQTKRGEEGIQEAEVPSELSLPASGMIRARNEGEGFQSIGWRFSTQFVFDRVKLLHFIQGLGVERLKGVFLTEEGVVGINLSGDALTEISLEEREESRVEILARRCEDCWEEQLLSCAKERP